MLDLKALTESVQHNCHISDAQYAGQYTLCIFLLKMREYYRWENAIPQSHALPKEAVGDWLTARENFWDELTSVSLSPLRVGSQQFEPFDSQSLNALLNPLGYVYSGGIGVFHKPYFFLGKLERKSEHNGITLMISSKEYARDLVAPPAMLQGNTVFIRKESLRRSIWERIEEWRMKSQPDTPMARTLACYGYHTASGAAHPDDTSHHMEAILDQLTDDELESAILHEIGEAQAAHILGPQWETLLGALPPRSKAELIVRAVRDHLADSLTTLPELLATQHTASLHFYFANLTGMRRELYPEALRAYQSWIESGTLASLKQLSQHGQQRWSTVAQDILALHSAGKDPNSLAMAIEKLAETTHLAP